MDFNFYLGNHEYPGRDTLTDGMYCLAAGLAELGHRFTVSSDRLDPTRINIIWEFFTPEQGREIAASGAAYGLVTTEIPDGGGFNNRRDGPWERRWEGFQNAAAKASFIWSLVEEAVPHYRPWAPSTFVELGFSQMLVPPKPTAPPTHDFSFFGFPTPYREALLARLGQRASIHWQYGFIPTFDLAPLIAKARVGIALKLGEDWPLPSATRLSRLMHAGVGVACQRTLRTTRQSRLLRQQPEDMDFVDFALDCLATHSPAEAASVLERYRVELPMKRVMEEVLDLTLPRGAQARQPA